MDFNVIFKAKWYTYIYPNLAVIIRATSIRIRRGVGEYRADGLAVTTGLVGRIIHLINVGFEIIGIIFIFGVLARATADSPEELIHLSDVSLYDREIFDEILALGK